jgi:cadmium resistance protein CadD (predicted permease)
MDDFLFILALIALCVAGEAFWQREWVAGLLPLFLGLFTLFQLYLK